MSMTPTSQDERPIYVAPRMTSYTEKQVAESLGPVLLSGSGADLGELAGGQAPPSRTSGNRRC